MSDKKIKVDINNILKHLVKSSNFNYQAAKAKRIKDRKGYDQTKEIKEMRKKLGTHRFGQYLAKTISEENLTNDYKSGGAYKAMLKLFRDNKLPDKNLDPEYSKKLKKFFKGDND